MRPDEHRTGRARGAGLPAALAGSIALSVLATPAHAADAGGIHDAALGAAARVPAVADAPAYEVRPGDTVTAIAGRHGLRTADVLSWNGLTWSSIIRPGQVLILSAPDAAGTSPAAPSAPAEPAAASTRYTVAAGDTVSAIARRHGVSTDAVLVANGLDRSSLIYPGQSVTIPGASAPAAAATPPAAPPAVPAQPAGSYLVVAGDTMSGIAGRHGVATDALLAANGLNRASIIYPGQTVIIPGAAAGAASPAPAAAAGLDAEQSAHAQAIISVGRALGVSDRGIAIALATAMQESSLRNLDHGPDDSLGLFQQRPSMGWGSEAEVRDPERATRVFFGGPADPNGGRTRGLLDIAGWEGMAFAQAAQTVQVSAYPDRYGAWEQSAYSWLAALG